MKERNILKRFENGWIIGLDDENNVVVQAPTGERGWPTPTPKGRYTVDGGLDAESIKGGANSACPAVEIPDTVMHFVHLTWDNQEKAREAQRKLEEELIDEENGRDPTPTLEELGFHENPKVDSI